MHIEYSKGIDAQQVEVLCRAVHGSMIEAGIFPLAGIRIRAYRADISIVADDHPGNDFLSITLTVGAGRTTEALKDAGDLIFSAAQSALAARLSRPHFALSLEVRVSDPALSWKDTPIHARLTRKD